MRWARVFGLLLAATFSGAFWWGVFSLLPAAQGTWRDLPPKRFRGDTTAVVTFTTEGEVQRRCPQPPGRYAVGCTVNGTIYVPNPCRWHDPYAGLLCHEIGHTQGWSGFHER